MEVRRARLRVAAVPAVGNELSLAYAASGNEPRGKRVCEPTLPIVGSGSIVVDVGVVVAVPVVARQPEGVPRQALIVAHLERHDPAHSRQFLGHLGSEEVYPLVEVTRPRRHVVATEGHPRLQREDDGDGGCRGPAGKRVADDE